MPIQVVVDQFFKENEVEPIRSICKELKKHPGYSQCEKVFQAVRNIESLFQWEVGELKDITFIQSSLLQSYESVPNYYESLLRFPLSEAEDQMCLEFIQEFRQPVISCVKIIDMRFKELLKARITASILEKFDAPSVYISKMRALLKRDPCKISPLLIKIMAHQEQEDNQFFEEHFRYLESQISKLQAQKEALKKQKQDPEKSNKRPEKVEKKLNLIRLNLQAYRHELNVKRKEFMQRNKKEDCYFAGSQGLYRDKYDENIRNRWLLYPISRLTPHDWQKLMTFHPDKSRLLEELSKKQLSWHRLTKKIGDLVIPYLQQISNEEILSFHGDEERLKEGEVAQKGGNRSLVAAFTESGVALLEKARENRWPMLKQKKEKEEADRLSHLCTLFFHFIHAEGFRKTILKIVDTKKENSSPIEEFLSPRLVPATARIRSIQEAAGNHIPLGEILENNPEMSLGTLEAVKMYLDAIEKSDATLRSLQTDKTFQNFIKKPENAGLSFDVDKILRISEAQVAEIRKQLALKKA